MGKFKFLLFSLVIMVLIILAGLVLPYVFYVKILYGGQQGKYVEMEGLPAAVHRGSFQSVKAEPSDDDNLWRVFHFSNYAIPLPLHHPQILVIPKIKKYVANKFLEFGVRMASTSAEDYATFILRSPSKLDWSDLKGKLFQLPITKKLIGSVSIRQIWEDLFIRDLSKYTDKSYRELIYNLFIQNMRLKLFSKVATKISYSQSNGIGIVQLADDDERFQREIFFILHENLIYSIDLRTRKWAILATGIRDRFLRDLEYRENDETSSALIYSEYKTLSYRERIDQEGMTYLYAAWSHVPDEKEFLREMIQFLERGENNTHHLSSLYQYAYRKFGSSFSAKKEMLKEKASSRLERKIEEEVRDEVELEKKEKFNETEGSFSNEKEKIQYFLRKAKDSGVDSDQSDDSLDE